MSEKEEEQKPAEQQQEKAPEKKPEAKPEVEAKVEAKTEEKPKEGASKKKRVKVSRMTLPEVEKELKTVQEKMGGFQSHFAQDLLARKKVLAESSKRS